MSAIYGATPTQSPGNDSVGESLEAQNVAETPRETISPTFTAAAPKHAYKPFHYVLMVFLFCDCSRIPEILPGAHFALVLSPILIAGLFLTDQVATLTRTRAGRCLLAFVAWAAVCVPFSTWKGGSFRMVLGTIQAVILVAWMVAFIQTVRDFRRTCYVIGVAIASSAILSFLIGNLRGGRASFGAGSLRDANTLCLYAVVGIPFLFVAAEMSTGIRRYLLLLTVPTLAVAARTGSRGGLLSLVVGTLFFFLHGTIKDRARVLVAGIVVVMLAMFFLPQSVLDRYFTYFQPQQASSQQIGAVESSEIRKLMLIRSLQMTAEHPIFGVGPGMFKIAYGQGEEEKGIHTPWYETHNSYTEASSETGIPGAILFIATIVVAYRGLTGLRKRNRNFQIRRMALYVQAALLMVSVGIFFLSMAWGGLLYFVLGVSIVLPLVAKRFPATAGSGSHLIARQGALGS